jgi:hypothetical protein
VLGSNLFKTLVILKIFVSFLQPLQDRLIPVRCHPSLFQPTLHVTAQNQPNQQNCTTSFHEVYRILECEGEGFCTFLLAFPSNAPPSSGHKRKKQPQQRHAPESRNYCNLNSHNSAPPLVFTTVSLLSTVRFKMRH